jgi:hypothetical protein
VTSRFDRCTGGRDESWFISAEGSPNEETFGLDREALAKFQSIRRVHHFQVERLHDGSHDQNCFLPCKRSSDAGSQAKAELKRKVSRVATRKRMKARTGYQALGYITYGL